MKQLVLLASLFPLDRKFEFVPNVFRFQRQMSLIIDSDHRATPETATLKRKPPQWFDCLLSTCQSSDNLAKRPLGLESELANYYVNSAKLPYSPISGV